MIFSISVRVRFIYFHLWFKPGRTNAKQRKLLFYLIAFKIEFNFFSLWRKEPKFYKGPDDPGFRIMDDLSIDKTISSFKDRFLKMYEVCSKHLVSMVIMGHEGNNIKLCFEIGIYQAGFNSEVLKMAISDLEEAMDEIKGLLDQFRKRY